MTVVAPERVVASGGAPKRRSRLVPLLLALVVGLATWVAVERLSGPAAPEGWTQVASLNDVQSAGVLRAQDVDVFLVHQAAEDKILALSAIDPRNQPIAYCETSGWFQDVNHGSQFDRLGRYGLGPAPRGLDRFPVLILGDDVYVDKSQTIPGPARYEPKADRPAGRFCAGPPQPDHG